MRSRNLACTSVAIVFMKKVCLSCVGFVCACLYTTGIWRTAAVSRRIGLYEQSMREYVVIEGSEVVGP